MPLSDLYLMNKKEISKLYMHLAENYYYNDFFCMLFPNDETRLKTLHHFFKHYVKAMRPYCHFVADNKEMHSVMVIWDSKLVRFLPYHFRLLRMNICLLPMLLNLRSWKAMQHVLSCFNMFTRRWIHEFVTESYFHLDLFFTQTAYRKQGIGQSMLLHLLTEGNRQQREITMVTHGKKYLYFCYKVGFVLMSEIVHPQDDIRQYNLLIKNT